jgi:hypothetical protein
MFSCSFTLCWRARSDETRELGSLQHSRHKLNTLENTIRSGILCVGNVQQKQWHYYHRIRKRTALSTYSALVKMCGIFLQHSYNGSINSHNGQLTRHTASHASDSGAVWQVEGTILGAKSELLYSEIASSPKPFGMGHMYMYNFLLRMVDIMASQKFYLPFWETLYIQGVPRGICHTSGGCSLC